MNVINALKTRRSVRVYFSKPIENELLRKILETAEFAPSSKGIRNWEYYLLKGVEKENICQMVLEELEKRETPFNKSSALKRPEIRMTNLASVNFIKQAPVLILVFNKAPYTEGEDNVIKTISPKSLLSYSVEIQGCSAFIYSVLVTAHGLGLGGCWIADINFCRKKISQYIGTKNDLVAGVVLGYPKEIIPPKKLKLKNLQFFEKTNG